jgi:o-succinylbenzoate synthase
MLSAWPYRLEARPGGPWEEARSGWLLRLGQGALAGWAEACPLPSWAGEGHDRTQAHLGLALSHQDEAEELLALPGPEALWGHWQLAPEHSPCAAFALEVAWWDAKARQAGQSLAATWAQAWGQRAPATEVQVNALLDALRPEAVEAQAKEAAATGHLAAKLKVGRLPWGEDLARVRAAKAGLGPLALRLDANGQWGLDEAEAALAGLQDEGIAYLEQPLAPTAWAELVALGRRSPIPIALDESLATTEDLEALAEEAAFPVWVVKPALLGPPSLLAPSLLKAKAKGKRLILTGALDRGVATLATAHLAAALGLDEVHGLSQVGSHVDPAPPVVGPWQGASVLLTGPGLAPHVHPGRLLSAQAKRRP